MVNKYIIIKDELSSGEERFSLLLDMGKLTPFLTLGAQRRFICLKYFDTEKEALEHISRMKDNRVIKQTTVFDSQDATKVKET